MSTHNICFYGELTKSIPKLSSNTLICFTFTEGWGERGGSVVECRTPEREVRGSRPTAAVLCP